MAKLVRQSKDEQSPCKTLLEILVDSALHGPAPVNAGRAKSVPKSDPAPIASAATTLDARRPPVKTGFAEPSTATSGLTRAHGRVSPPTTSVLPLAGRPSPAFSVGINVGTSGAPPRRSATASLPEMIIVDDFDFDDAAATEVLGTPHHIGIYYIEWRIEATKVLDSYIAYISFAFYFLSPSARQINHDVRPYLPHDRRHRVGVGSATHGTIPQGSCDWGRHGTSGLGQCRGRCHYRRRHYHHFDWRI